MHFSWIFFWHFSISWEVLRKNWLERYMQLSFMHLCKYLNQRLRRIGEYNGKPFKGVSKTNRKKKQIKKLYFITQFKIEFLLLFTGFRKVLEKMPGLIQQRMVLLMYQQELLEDLIILCNFFLYCNQFLYVYIRSSIALDCLSSLEFTFLLLL